MKSSSRKSLARSAAVVPTPTHADISAAATLLWIERGRPDSQDEVIWLEAERRLRSSLPATKNFRTTEAGSGNTETAMDELDDLYPGGSGSASTAL